MRNLLIATIALASTLAAPAHAAAPDGAEAGQHDAGWMRVVCNGTTTDQRCHLRVSKGFKKMTTTIVVGNEIVGISETTPYRPHTVRVGRQFDRRITSGVRVACGGEGNVIECTVQVRSRLDRFSLTEWSAGENYGGVVWTTNPR